MASTQIMLLSIVRSATQQTRCKDCDGCNSCDGEQDSAHGHKNTGLGTFQRMDQIFDTRLEAAAGDAAAQGSFFVHNGDVSSDDGVRDAWAALIERVQMIGLNVFFRTKK